MSKLTFSLPSAIERRDKLVPKLDKLKAVQVMAFTGIRHQKLWFFLFVTLPDDRTRDVLSKYFSQKSGDIFVYVLDNSHALEVTSVV